jgi:N-acetylglucosamine-6-phosphate deacetylase
LRRNGRLTLEDGTLAGADLDMISAVRFLVKHVGVDLEEALRMASLYPAKLLGRSHEIGQLIKGARANFLHLGDGIVIQNVWRDGAELG